MWLDAHKNVSKFSNLGAAQHLLEHDDFFNNHQKHFSFFIQGLSFLHFLDEETDNDFIRFNIQKLYNLIEFFLKFLLDPLVAAIDKVCDISHDDQ
jgi:hypothetical protein